MSPHLPGLPEGHITHSRKFTVNKNIKELETKHQNETPNKSPAIKKICKQK